MSDPKLSMLAGVVKVVMNSPGLHIWLSIPGGLIMGRATDLDDYLDNMFGPDSKSSELPGEVRDASLEQNRFIFLKGVTLRQENMETLFAVAMVDALDVAAWGFFDPTSATRETR